VRIPGPGLAGWLAIIAAALVSIAVLTISVFGIRLLRDLAKAEALTRVELAVSSSQEMLRQITDAIATATRVLSERPTLHRLVQDSQVEQLTPYLVRYCEGAGLDGCAVVRGGKTIATTAPEVDWQQILAASAEQGDHYLATGAIFSVPVAGARVEVLEADGWTVHAIRRLDETVAVRLSERAGLEIRIVDLASYDPEAAGPFTVLDSDALSAGGAVADRLRSAGLFAASMPVSASSGEAVALLRGLLPESEVMQPVDRLTRELAVVALLVTALGIAAGIVTGRRLTVAIRGLTDAARRIGSGDLAASIPVVRSDELGVLADTMEEMRRNLVELTSQLRSRESEARAVVGGIVEGVYTVDDFRRIRFLNPQAEKLLGQPASEVVGRFCGDVLNPARDAQGRRPCDVACPILEARRAGTGQAAERIEPAPGHIRHVVIASAAPTEGMQVQVMRDETELEAVRRTRDTVLANISHEFRTPLSAQLASIELLRDGLGEMDAASERELVLSLERGTHRLTRLIDNLLESVRIESGQLGIRRQRVALGEVLNAARELIGPLLEQRGQRLELPWQEPLPTLAGDQQRLTQVMVNLLANASKFSPADSTIRVGAEPAARGVRFWVEDEGPGPADPADGGLFERFHRSGGEDPDESGLGLGLYIVRSIVERHGGSVRLIRTPAGRTRVEVELPGEAPVENSACG